MESFFYIAQKIMSPKIDPYIYQDNFIGKVEFTNTLQKIQPEMTLLKSFFYNLYHIFI